MHPSEKQQKTRTDMNTTEDTVLPVDLFSQCCSSVRLSAISKPFGNQMVNDLDILAGVKSIFEIFLRSGITV